MPVRLFESPMPASASELFDWHSRPGAFERLCPPWQSIEIEQPATVENGSQARLRMRKGPLSFRWIAEHRDVEPGRGFTDVQRSGPFSRWTHRHEFLPRGETSILRDHLDYALPGGPLGRLIGGASVRHDIDSTFAFRHETTRRDLARHAAYAREPRLRVAVTGSSGLVGGELAAFLSTGGHTVVPLRRGAAARPGEVQWSPDEGLAAPETVEPFDVVVHLAGESVASGRWTAARKRRIRESRVAGTRNLIRSLAGMKRPPRAFVCASAVGFYGSRDDEPLDEAAEPGAGFLAGVCRDWEEAADGAVELGARVVKLRFGVVLTPAGGALAKMLPAFRLGAGGRLGSGRQFMSWVSIDDAIGAIHHALFEPRISGPINVTAPAPVTNREFTKALGSALSRPALFPMPSAAARAVFGEMADEMLLSSARALPRALEATGFSFEDPALDSALSRLLGKAGSA